MKNFFTWSFTCLLSLAGLSQASNPDNTLLWRISGKDLKAPSYLFGTIHMICGDDIQLSDSLRSAIRKSDNVYLEVDLNNLFEMISIVSKMKMNGDTTLSDLVTPSEYENIKAFFKSQKSILPFSMMETYKPMLTASTLMQSSMECDNAVAMEQLIMAQAKKDGIKIKGLETMAYQMSIFDSIPYKLQAQQLVQYVNDYGKNDDNKEFEELITAYRNQELQKLEDLTKKGDASLDQFADVLLYNRNRNWVNKMETLMPEKSVVIAVGAGHLPGEFGVIKLLRKAGYKVEPVKNEMIKKGEKQL
jgi:uncharacterized protein YbaP (TraB family)